MTEYFKNNRVKPNIIPDLLKSLDQWVIWKAFNKKSDGRFSKIPICPSTGYKINHLDRSKHMPFECALGAYQAGCSDGIGISLTGEPFKTPTSEKLLYLIGLDLDKVAGCPERKSAASSICKSVNSYAEITPSGTGLRIFALSEQLLGKGQSAFGEMYASGRFLTITGHGTLRPVRVATTELEEIQKAWWPHQDKVQNSDRLQNNPKPVFPDTPKNRATLFMWLNNISADCVYERYRDVVWAILSTDWQDAEQIAHEWCMSAPERFDPVNFGKVVQSYNADHRKPITVRSLAYWSNRVMSDE